MLDGRAVGMVAALSIIWVGAFFWLGNDDHTLATIAGGLFYFAGRRDQREASQ